MTKDELRAIWDQVRANHAAWDACKGPHELEDLTPERKLGKKYRCRLCGGECDGVAKNYYDDGLRHGRESR